MIADNDVPTADSQQRATQEIQYVHLGDQAVIWGGTDDEAEALLDAVARYSECEGEDCASKPFASLVPDCPSHMMLYDQRTLDGLLMVRRSRQRWILGEMTR